MKGMRLIILLVQGAMLGMKTGGLALARKVARFERNSMSRLSDVPSGLIELSVLGLYTAIRSGSGMFPALLLMLLILLFFLLR